MTTLSSLKRSALWIIVDPWIYQPRLDDDLDYAAIDRHNRQLIEPLATFSKDLEHCVIKQHGKSMQHARVILSDNDQLEILAFDRLWHLSQHSR